MYSRGHAILGHAVADKLVYLLPRPCTSSRSWEDAGYKQEIEKWDTDSDPQESDKDEE